MTPPPDARPPAADRPIDPGRIESLCTELVPEPGIAMDAVNWSISTDPIGEGWDNVLWPVGTLDGIALVLRVARRELSRPLLEREAHVLRHLARAAELPMRIPAPLATTADAVLTPWVGGRTAAEAGTTERGHTAGDLARMLAAVHSQPTGPIEPGLHRSTVRGVPLAHRDEAFRNDLAAADLAAATKDRAREDWEQGMAAPVWTGADRLLHGDPHPGNVVVPDGAVGDESRPVLIDWGDTTIGDPACDLGGLLLHAPSAPLLSNYRAVATWPGVDRDEVFEPLATRASAWATRMALGLLTAYPPTHPLGRVGTRFLSR